jgi:hypothetical protein
MNEFPKPAARRIYPWESWTDGNAHVLERGVHFDLDAAGLCKAARRYASTHGMRVDAWRRGRRVWLQFSALGDAKPTGVPLPHPLDVEILRTHPLSRLQQLHNDLCEASVRRCSR